MAAVARTATGGRSASTQSQLWLRGNSQRYDGDASQRPQTVKVPCMLGIFARGDRAVGFSEPGARAHEDAQY